MSIPKPKTMSFCLVRIWLVVALTFCTITGKTQSVSASWPLTANMAASTSGVITAADQRLTGLSINNYISGGGGQRTLPPGGNWPAESGANAARFTEFVFVSDSLIVMDTIRLSLSFNSSSAGRARICYNIGSGSLNDLAAAQVLVSGSVPTAYNFNGLNITVPAGDTFRLRVYPWSTSAQSARYLVTKSVSITGTANPAPSVAIPAFPGAEGGGYKASGGRGGSIYYVTNLNNSGSGSLRDAVSQPGRTVLFKVSGTINLLSPLAIQHDNITIAGQTAPGDGICLANYGIRILANNIIIRYIRSRPGDIILNPGDTTKVVDAMYNSFGTPVTSPYKNIIIDHCSLSWSTDELGSFYAIADFTLQWSILSEALYKSVHDKTSAHGYGGIWGGQNASFHHNLLAHNGNRNPRFSGSAATGQPEKEYVDFRNNVIYNWVGSPYGGTGGHQNMIANYYKPGPATTGSTSCASSNRRHRILLYTTFTVTDGDTSFGGKFYIKNNVVDGYSCVTETTDTATNNWRFGVHPDSSPGAAAALAAGKSDTLFPASPVTTETASAAYTSVTTQAGASLPRRDTIDRRIIRETLNGTATYGDTSYQAAGMGNPSGMIDSQNTVGGWPTLSSTTYPNDTDNDGLPDWWEAMINNSSDTTGVNANTVNPDGYTQLEHYLNNIQSPDQQVQFTSLHATQQNDDTVRVNFAIDWAKDLFKLRLYRSTDGNSFTAIDSTNAGINTISFLLNDFNAPQTSVQYRIGSKRTDGKGTEQYSNTVTINNTLLRMNNQQAAMPVEPDNNKAAEAKLSVYPNPVTNELFIRHAPAAEKAEIWLYALSGQLLQKKRLAKGSERNSLQVAALPAGIYKLVYRTNNTIETVSFMKY